MIAHSVGEEGWIKVIGIQVTLFKVLFRTQTMQIFYLFKNSIKEVKPSYSGPVMLLLIKEPKEMHNSSSLGTGAPPGLGLAFPWPHPASPVPVSHPGGSSGCPSCSARASPESPDSGTACQEVVRERCRFRGSRLRAVGRQGHALKPGCPACSASSSCRASWWGQRETLLPCHGTQAAALGQALLSC